MMKDIKHIGAEEFTISKSKDHWLNNSCPYLPGGLSTIKVGSATCSECKYNVKMDEKKNIVVCCAKNKGLSRIRAHFIIKGHTKTRVK